MIQVEYDDTLIIQALDRIVQASGRLAPVLKGIGETLAASTKERFGESKSMQPAGPISSTSCRCTQ